MQETGKKETEPDAQDGQGYVQHGNNKYCREQIGSNYCRHADELQPDQFCFTPEIVLDLTDELFNEVQRVHNNHIDPGNYRADAEANLGIFKGIVHFVHFRTSGRL